MIIVTIRQTAYFVIDTLPYFSIGTGETLFMRFLNVYTWCRLLYFVVIPFRKQVSRTTTKSVVTLSKRSASKGLGNDFSANANETRRSLDSASQNYCMIATGNHGNL